MRVAAFQTNHEGAFLEHVHGLAGAVDGAVVNPGAWTHYQWSIRDALELLGAPFVEVHLSDIEAREPHRRDLRGARHRRGGRLGQGPRRLPRGPRPPRGDARVSAPRRARQERAAGRAERAGPRRAARHRPRQRPLPHGLRRHRTASPCIGGSGRVLFTDSRYAVSAREQVRGVEVVHRPARPARRRGRARSRDGRAGRPRRRRGRAPHPRPPRAAHRAAGRASRLEPTRGVVEDLRSIKEPDEVAAMREAAAVADRALARRRSTRAIVGRTERDVAFALYGAMLRRGRRASRASPSSSRPGPSGARPHAVPGPRPDPAATRWW